MRSRQLPGASLSIGVVIGTMLLVLQSCDGPEGAAPPKLCDSDDDCREWGSRCDSGHDGGRGECGTQCLDEVCQELDPRQLCTSQIYGRCAAVACSSTIPCVDPAEVCDEGLPAARCVPRSGACVDVTACPVFDKAILEIANRFCDPALGFCRLSTVPSSSYRFWPSAKHVVVDSPQPGQSFASAEEIRFAWQRTETSAIAVVLRDLPEGHDVAQIAELSIWGAARTVDAPTEIAWSTGVAVSSGIWQGAPTPPPSSPLYFLILGVDQGKVVAASDYVPFRVAGAWPHPGDTCFDEGAIPGDCASVAVPMRCLGGLCWQLCLSGADCPSPLVCSDPVLKTRLCVP